jgi:hypothetical protein
MECEWGCGRCLGHMWDHSQGVLSIKALEEAKGWDTNLQDKVRACQSGAVILGICDVCDSLLRIAATMVWHGTTLVGTATVASNCGYQGCPCAV